MDKATIDGIEYNISVDYSNGKDMTAKAYYRIVDGVIQILKIDRE